MTGSFSVNVSASGRSGKCPDSHKAGGSQSLDQPLPRAAENIDSEEIVKIERSIETIHGFIQPSKTSSARRAFFGWTIGASGTSFTASGTSLPTANIGATSNVFRDMSKEIDDVLQRGESRHQRTFINYLRNLESIKNHRFDRVGDELRSFQGSQDDWQLLMTAAKAADTVYNNEGHDAKTEVFKIARNQKFMTMYVKEVAASRVLVVAIRGSVTMDDWGLNFNSAPKRAPELLDGDDSWHGGFLTVAKAMERATAKGISDLLAREERIDSLLFSGHSAGGAIAQIFYAMSMSPRCALAKETANFEKVHCITFGAPPIASVALHAKVHQKPGRFWSVVNEGDPVAQAQEEFVKVLIKVYLDQLDDVNKDFSQGLVIPEGHFRASGNPLILLDEDPDDVDAEGFQACITSSSTLEKMLFGNPFVHARAEYVRRVRALAAASGLLGETDSADTKEMVVSVKTETYV